MPLLCCDVGLVSELRLTVGCVLMDLASPAVSGTSVYANGLRTNYSMEQRAEIYRIPEFPYRFYKCLPLLSVLSQMNIVLILPSMPMFSK